MRQAIIWNNAYPIHWRIYAALGGDEFKYPPPNEVIYMHYIFNASPGAYDIREIFARL